MTIDDEGERAPTTAEINRIKVTLKCESPEKLPKNVVIKLNRLTDSEIETYTNPPKRENVFISSCEKVVDVESQAQKRKSDVLNSITTRSKRRKLENGAEIVDIKNKKSENLNETKAKFSNEIVDKKNNTTEKNAVTIVAKIPFVVNEVIWAKLRGWSYHWPARITKIFSGKVYRFEVYWFNDYRTSKIFRSQIYKFGPNFSMFSENFDNVPGLRQAAEEATVYGMRNRSVNKDMISSAHQ